MNFSLYVFLIVGLIVSDRPIKKEVKIGAYYFDGWTGVYPNHITEKLKDSFNNREPIWGWVTSKQEIVDQQIETASSSGLSFFSFCWYHSKGKKENEEPLNRALSYFRKSSKKKRLEYCLLIANHQNHEILPQNWDLVTDEWIDNFSDSQYLKENGKPLIIFFSVSSLVAKFGSPNVVKSVFDDLRQKARIAGFKGVSIAACTSPTRESVEQAESCGFDLITGYNYHRAGFSKNSYRIPIDSLISAERRVWDIFPKLSSLKYIPVATLNWDPRPWANSTNNFDVEPFYVGYSPESVYRSVRNCLGWLRENEKFTVMDQMAILYAWNENGEGAWLTPTKNGVKLTDGLEKALKEQ